jgi:hypothetical protein
MTSDDGRDTPDFLVWPAVGSNLLEAVPQIAPGGTPLPLIGGPVLLYLDVYTNFPSIEPRTVAFLSLSAWNKGAREAV